jgi:hypothetical protein
VVGPAAGAAPEVLPRGVELVNASRGNALRIASASRPISVNPSCCGPLWIEPSSPRLGCARGYVVEIDCYIAADGGHVASNWLVGHDQAQTGAQGAVGRGNDQVTRGVSGGARESGQGNHGGGHE